MLNWYVKTIALVRLVKGYQVYGALMEKQEQHTKKRILIILISGIFKI